MCLKFKICSVNFFEKLISIPKNMLLFSFETLQASQKLTYHDT